MMEKILCKIFLLTKVINKTLLAGLFCKKKRYFTQKGAFIML